MAKFDDARPAIDQAMRTIYAAWSAGCWIELDRGTPTLTKSPFYSGNLPALSLNLNQPMLREILPANRKDWAERRDEFAIAPVYKEGALIGCGLVQLEQRRVLGPGVIVQDPKKLPRRLQGCNGVIMPRGLPHKEKLALWLWEAGMLRNDVLIIEVPNDESDEDYRNVISGSHWLKSTVKPGPNEPIAAALLTAMAVRSFRKEAIRVNRPGWWTSLAGAAFARSHNLTGEAACRQMGLGWDELGERVNKALAYKPWSPPAAQAQAADALQTPPAILRPAVSADGNPAVDSSAVAPTEKQISLIASLLKAHPVMEPLAKGYQQMDRRQVSALITRLLAALEKIKIATEEHKRQIDSIIAGA